MDQRTVRIDGRADIRKDGRKNGELNGQTDEWQRECMSPTVGRTDGRTDSSELWSLEELTRRLSLLDINLSLQSSKPSTSLNRIYACVLRMEVGYASVLEYISLALICQFSFLLSLRLCHDI